MKNLQSSSMEYEIKPLLEILEEYTLIKKSDNGQIAIYTFSKNNSKDGVLEIFDTEVDSFQTKCLKYGISNREISIVLSMAQGKTNKEIGNSLFISPSTVKTHVQNIYEKVGAANRIELLKKLAARI